MVDFFASRPMEDFFINPTIVDDATPYTFPSMMTSTTPTTTTVTMDGTSQYRAALRDYHHERRSSSTTKAPALKQFALPTRLSLAGREASFNQGYTSEEEQPSPVDNDNDTSSVQSRGAISVGSDVSIPEELASSCSSVEQQCNQARVVKIHPVGRARMVSLPKLITSPSRRRIVRPAEHSNDAKRLELRKETRSVRNSEDSSTSSDSSTSLASPVSTAPSSVDDMAETAPPLRHKKAISRHVPLLEAARAITPTSPNFPPSATAIRRGSTGLHEPSMSSRSSIDSASRKGSKFGLNRAFTIAKSSVRKEDSNELESIKEPEPSVVAPLPVSAQVPSRRISLNRRKLVARGAGEREPPIILPPFPA